MEWPVESKTPGREGTIYHVRLWLKPWRAFEKDSLSCDCKSWIFKKGPVSEKYCKHTEEIARVLARTSSVRNVSEFQGHKTSAVQFMPLPEGISRIDALKKELEALA
jgi:hypothetical protein